ncbi:MAG: DUF1508 domain-containing protein [Burkholderiales bacterium]|nr:DUF1508 domain-containing protein [Burkholderiales bacterium]
MAYYIYKDEKGQWRWYLLAANNRKIANSGEGYWNLQDCKHAISLVSTSGQCQVYTI